MTYTPKDFYLALKNTTGNRKNYDNPREVRTSGSKIEKIMERVLSSFKRKKPSKKR